ncbi:hypothetical protein [Aureibacter tunicatorum]|uniref:Leucine-binding protein domain-containing protein n=1 Tax=Aureibacter tunicatorum TaxID=866807 RepID=A0AAE3XN03_9BACT|nr:hypothetical protein [Aureibacter tunicatorum]MDR6238943.1 hypothetical protein [Aureibacter tunicatorum]BDD05131.1 hypothetical protein AUTU_26140 [Aureibacter tunicatorum]
MLSKPSRQDKLKVGVLIPQSHAYPEAPLHYVRGLQLYFTLHKSAFKGKEVELKIKQVGGGSLLGVQKAWQELMIEGGLTCVVGFLSSQAGMMLGDLGKGTKTPILICNLGESAISEDQVYDHLFFHGLHYWQSYYYLGKHVGEQYREKSIYSLSSFFDSGYDPLRAFNYGLEASKGFIQKHVTLHSNNVEELKDELDLEGIEKKDAVAVCLMHPNMLSNFLETYNSSFSDIICSPFCKGNDRKRKLWAFPNWRHENESFRSLKTGVQEYFPGTELDLFHYLGFEQGKFLSKAFEKLESKLDTFEVIVETWEAYQEDTDFETISMNPDSHQLERKVCLFSGSNYKNNYRIIDEFDIKDLKNEESIAPLFEMNSSFINPYMCY